MAAPLIANARTRAGRTRIIELVGPAGAGKTTLCVALRGYPELFRECFPPVVWSLRDAPFYATNLLRLVPTIAALRGNRITRREAAWMAALEGWPERLKIRAKSENRILVLDQGPVFLITTLQNFADSSLRRPEAERWWKKIYSRWATTVDTVIWLDAPDPELIGRIRTRSQEHMVKDKSDAEIAAFIASYRSAYRNVISRMTILNGKLSVLNMDTSAGGPGDTLEKLFTSLGVPATRVMPVSVERSSR